MTPGVAMFGNAPSDRHHGMAGSEQASYNTGAHQPESNHSRRDIPRPEPRFQRARPRNNSTVGVRIVSHVLVLSHGDCIDLRASPPRDDVRQTWRVETNI